MCRQYNQDLEEGMDRAYEDYLKRHGQREKVLEQKRARLQKTPRGLDGAPLEEDEEASGAAAAAPVQAPVHEVLSYKILVFSGLPVLAPGAAAGHPLCSRLSLRLVIAR